MLGNERWLGEMHEPLEPPQVIAIERVDGSQRQTNTMQAQRIQLAQREQIVDLRSAISEVVLAVRLQPTDVGSRAQQVVVMLRSQVPAGTFTHSLASALVFD